MQRRFFFSGSRAYDPSHPSSSSSGFFPGNRPLSAIGTTLFPSREMRSSPGRPFSPRESPPPRETRFFTSAPRDTHGPKTPHAGSRLYSATPCMCISGLLARTSSKLFSPIGPLRFSDFRLFYTRLETGSFRGRHSDLRVFRPSASPEAIDRPGLSGILLFWAGFSPVATRRPGSVTPSHARNRDSTAPGQPRTNFSDRPTPAVRTPATGIPPRDSDRNFPAEPH